VVVVDLDPTEGESSAELVRQRGGDAHFVRSDVTKSGDVQNYVKATLDTYGAIDCFFNNAGIEGKVAPTQEYDEAVFDAVISVNCSAPGVITLIVGPNAMRSKQTRS
jgi:NAD(P)-dependent dehydrogenase (short-subunit alcohol dehydrogenase family)